MQEYSSEALVLASGPQRDSDLGVSLFTLKFGKIQARARSARKITSKLVGHLQPGVFARVRLVEKAGVHVVDALKIKTSGLPLAELDLLADVLPVFQPEPELWRMLCGGSLVWSEALRILGWDPARAECTVCKEPRPDYFRVSDQEFFCVNCASQLPPKKLIYIDK